MKRKPLILLGILGVIAAGYYYLQFSSTPTPARLTERALTAGDGKERRDAVVELAMLTDKAVLPEMRRLAGASKDPDVLTICLTNLVNRIDLGNLPVFLANLENESLEVRQTALRGVLSLTGIPADSVEFQPGASPEVRGPAYRKLTEQCRQIQEGWANPKPQPRPNLVALTANTPAKIKDDARDSVKDAPAPLVSPSSPGSPSPAPANAPQAMPQQDYPAIQLLVWMCRVLAVLALIAEVAGAVSLILGERGQSESAKRKNKSSAPPTVEEQIEKILARNSAGLWSKIVTLIGGAGFIVALLIAAELIPLVVRVEQKLDNVSRVR